MSKLGWCITGHHQVIPNRKGTCPGEAPGILGRPTAHCSCECHDDPGRARPAPPPPSDEELFDEDGCRRERRSTP